MEKADIFEGLDKVRNVNCFLTSFRTPKCTKSTSNVRRRTSNKSYTSRL